MSLNLALRSGRMLFSVRDNGCETRGPVKRFEIVILFEVQIIGRRQSVVHCLS